jgi:hypothetical protein
MTEYIEQIESEIKRINKEISSLEMYLYDLERRKRKILSKKYIAENNITLDKVEMSNGENLKWFGHISEFVEWLKDNSTKEYAEWNGGIYSQSELKRGYMTNTNVIVDDLKERNRIQDTKINNKNTR